MTETNKKPELGDVKEKDDCIYIYDGTEYIKCTPEEYFTVIGNTIVGYNTEGGTDVVIPPKINGKMIIYIAYNSFKYFLIPKSITSIVFPNTIKEIGDYAFAFNNLEKLKLPNSIEKIGDGVFYNNRLTELELPNTIKEIGDYAFAFNNLEKLKLPNSIEKIGDGAFIGNKLENLTIPNSVKEIGINVFKMNGAKKNSSNITDWYPGNGGTWKLNKKKWIKQ